MVESARRKSDCFRERATHTALHTPDASMAQKAALTHTFETALLHAICGIVCCTVYMRAHLAILMGGVGKALSEFGEEKAAIAP